MAANPREITRREEEDGATRAEEEKAEKEEEEEVGVEAVIGAIADDASPPLSAPRASSTLIPLSLRRVDAHAIAEIIRSQLERARRAGSERAGEAFARFFELWFDSPFFFFDFSFFLFFSVLSLAILMATALRPDSRRVAEATPAAITAAFLFEAAVCAAARTTGAGAPAGGGDAPPAAASIDDDSNDTDAGGVSAAASRKKKPRVDLSTAALSHSLALAAGKVRGKLGEAREIKEK